MGEEPVQDELGNRALLELEDDAHALAVGFVAEVGDAVEDLVPDELGDAGDQGGLVDRIGNFGEDDLLAAGLHRLDDELAADDDLAPAGDVGLADAPAAEDDAARGEVGTLHVPHELIDGDLGIVDKGGNGLGRSPRGCAAPCWWPCRPRCRSSR